MRQKKGEGRGRSYEMEGGNTSKEMRRSRRKRKEAEERREGRMGGEESKRTRTQ